MARAIQTPIEGPGPAWNLYDNIWDIMKTLSTEQWDQRFVDEIASAKAMKERATVRGKARIHRTVGSFLNAIRKKPIRLPCWKIVIPHLPSRNLQEGMSQLLEGSIYYVVNTPEGGTAAGTNHLFRGTFGYAGTGPHESALIEWFLTKTRGCYFEIRDGDFLLGFMEA